MKFPINISSHASPSIGYRVDSSVSLREVAKKLLKLSSGFIAQCSDEELIEYLRNRRYDVDYGG